MSAMLDIAGGVIIAAITLGAPIFGIAAWVEGEKGGGNAGALYGLGGLAIGGSLMFYIFIVHGHIFSLGQ